MKRWFVYVLECSDGSLYTGATTDVVERLATHQDGKGAKYTRGRLPVKLLGYVDSHDGFDQSAALSLEAAIKRLTPSEKRAFISGRGEHWNDFLNYGLLRPRICTL